MEQIEKQYEGVNAIQSAIKFTRKLQKENRRFRKALMFYADNMGASRSKDIRIVYQDQGKTAREALDPKPKIKNPKRDLKEK